MYSFENFQAIKYFGRDIYKGEFTLKEANKDQSSLLVEIINFKNKTKPQELEKNKRKKMLFKTCMPFLMAEKELLLLLKIKYFQ